MKIILLDIDGVISIDRARYSCGAPTNKADIPNKNNIHRTHIYRPDVVSSINSLAANPNVEIKFLSNWGSAAESVFAKYVGLKNIGYTEIDSEHRGYKSIEDAGESPLLWYKSKMVLEEALKGNDVLFIDDRISLPLALEFSKHLPTQCGWIKTHPGQGLTPAHMERIRGWVNDDAPVLRYHSGEKW